ncbi:hypothetical protein BC937DRAFT_90088 [Endogone sp. FLAS-F59071]|nr:hypothetical protein BC937DRAFT_90088 [Endogone sp. FLAS-F59071]|eukprot:RUS17344.1 hypothetical protein BC937DRAFT_90088 [Endogone sp. FLAS-F59071]
MDFVTYPTTTRSVLLFFLSGLPRSEPPAAEKQWKKGNWANYSAYLNETSILVPIPRFLYRPLPTFLKHTLLLDLPLYQFVPPTEPESEQASQSPPAGDGEDAQ